MRRVAAEDKRTVVLFWLQIACLVVFIVPALLAWQPLGFTDLAMTALVAALTLGLYGLMVGAYRRAEAITLVPAFSSAVPFTALAGWLCFKEIPTVFLWAGTALVVLSILLSERSTRA
jgi:drug/metabolite transporter (DMT)-like permease